VRKRRNYLKQALDGMSGIFGLFSRSPLQKLQKEYDTLLTMAFQAQRNGNIRLYSTLTAEAEALREDIEALKTEMPC
jgi:hypothetical protein